MYARIGGKNKCGQADDTPVEKCVYFITKQGDDL